MRVISTLPFTLLRMLKSYIFLLLLLVVPMLLLTFFYFILSDAVNESGESYLYETAISQVLVFQLFGGSIVMTFIHYDLFTKHKERMQLLPFHLPMYAASIVACGTLFSIILGVCLMVFSHFVLGVMLGNELWMLFIICLMAILSSVVCLILTFSVKSFKLAERLSEIYGIGFVVLAGLFFPMPQTPFFQFMGSYGNPLALSIMSVKEMNRGNSSEALQYACILLLAIAVLFVVMLLTGRRKWG